MGSFGGQVWQVWAAGAAMVALVVGLLASKRLRRLAHAGRWWAAGAAVVVLAFVFLVMLPRRYPPHDLPLATLPGIFRRGYWAWMYLFLLVTGAGLVSLVDVIRSRRRDEPIPESPGTEAGEAELDRAWQEIRVRLSQAGIDPSGQRVVLLLAPESGAVESLLDSAGLQVFVKAPERAAPIHAHATPDGLLIECVGASAFGTGRDEGARLLEGVCRRLLAEAPDCPIVRGVVVLFPYTWAGRSESVRAAAEVREDLQAMARTLKVRLPAFALFTGMEAAPGFSEFLGRLVAQVSPRMAEQRVGFAIPSTQPFSGDLIRRGLDWMSAWFHNWTLNLMAGNPLDHPSNAAIASLDAEIRRSRPRFRAILEAAFAAPRESEPVLFRGCYFAATGTGRDRQGFSAGLLRGPRSRILADHVATDWGDDAWHADRRYVRIAWAIAAVGVLLSLPALLLVVRLTPWGWLVLLGLVALWAVVLWKRPWG